MTKRNSKAIEAKRATGAQSNSVAKPVMNKKHSVVIRMGAMEDSISIDGHKYDIGRKRPAPQHAENGREESFKDYLGRRQRIATDLVGMVFA